MLYQKTTGTIRINAASGSTSHFSTATGNTMCSVMDADYAPPLFHARIEHHDGWM
jgi:hypothetical protein